MRRKIFLVALVGVTAMALRSKPGALVLESARKIGPGVGATAPLPSTASALGVAAPAALVAPGNPESVSVFLPRARLVAKVVDPVDAKGRRKVIETVQTSVGGRYLRLVQTFVPDGRGGMRRAGEAAMVANQLLLAKPSAFDAATFANLLRLAGAVDVRELNERAFLATFPPRPQDPRALDSYMSQVRQIAGADVTVVPNYIRKVF